MSRRVSQGYEKLADLVPEGVDVDALHDLVEGDVPGEEDLDDILGRGFKVDTHNAHATAPRIRPILVALAARAVGADSVQGEAMYAAEFLHRALQVHDAALGRQGGKRRWLARKVVKRSVSLLSGNHLTLRALELTRHSQPEVLSDLVDTLRSFSDGDQLLRELQSGRPPGESDWLEHADAHTGALFSFCCRAGAWLAEAERAQVTALGRYGRHLGRLWHIAEDVSMLEHGDGGAHLVARALAARPILVVALASEEHPEIAAMWKELVLNPTATRGDALYEALQGTRALALARERMVQEAWTARKLVRSLPESRYRRTLDKLARGLVKSGVGA